MGETKPGYSPRRAGEVVGVDVEIGADRPVTVTCHDHAHTYEFDWHDTAGDAVITDLRVTSRNGTPITSATLKRINTDTLLKAARRYDTRQAAEQARELRRLIEAATAEFASDPASMVVAAIAYLESLDDDIATELARELRRVATETDPEEMVADGAAGIERFRFTDGVLDAMVRRLPLSETPPKSRGGRPRLSNEFLVQVADWAREASARNAGAVYDYVAARAANQLGYIASVDTVKGWIRRCKDTGLLGPNELRRPRRPRNAVQGEDQ
jgi:hypothetical protein